MNIIINSGPGMDWVQNIFGTSIQEDKCIYYKDKYELIENIIFKYLCKMAYSNKIRKLKLKIKYTRWYKYFAFNTTKNKKWNISYLVKFNWDYLSFDKEYILYLKKVHPEVKVILIFTGSIKLSKSFYQHQGLHLSDIKAMYDNIYTFEKEDAKKYGLGFLPLMFNTQKKFMTKKIMYDLCYVGNAKDRLNSIHSIYENAIRSGLKCCFYVNGVKKYEKIYNDIIYNKKISYEKSLKISNSSKCILEILQGEASTSTIRIAEAIIFNKLVITNNIYIKDEEYYNDKYIKILNNRFEIDKQFIQGGVNWVKNPYCNSITQRELFSYIEYSNKWNASV